MIGTVYLIPSFLGAQDVNSNFPALNAEKVNSLRNFVCENIKHTRRFIRALGVKTDFEEVTLLEMGKHADQYQALADFERILKTGASVGIVSEAGNPCIADPGNKFVEKAHAIKAHVVPLVGPSSILMALIGSGLNGQSFTFHGYLPKDKGARLGKLKQIEKDAITTGYAQIFMETPFKNNALIIDVLENCSSALTFCMASNIQYQEQKITAKTIAKWKAHTLPNLHKVPAVFVLGKSV